VFLVPRLTDKLSENISAKVSPDRKEWLKQQAESPYFSSEGAVIRAALDYLELVGPPTALQKLEEETLED
jgi:Arc/MetJ-type ribon-helix-helix transcriptional regulator